MKTQVTVTHEVDMTIDQLAELFINWDSRQQAEFLNKVGHHFRHADFPAEMQCAYMTDEIKKDGKDFIFTLANFLKCKGVPSSSPKWGKLLNHYGGDSLDYISPQEAS